MVDSNRPAPGEVFDHLGNLAEPYEIIGHGLIQEIPLTTNLQTLGAILGSAYLGIAFSAEGYEESGELNMTEHHVFQAPDEPWCHIIIIGEEKDGETDLELHCVYRQGDHGNFPRQLWVRTEDNFRQNFKPKN